MKQPKTSLADPVFREPGPCRTRKSFLPCLKRVKTRKKPTKNQQNIQNNEVTTHTTTLSTWKLAARKQTNQRERQRDNTFNTDLTR